MSRTLEDVIRGIVISIRHDEEDPVLEEHKQRIINKFLLSKIKEQKLQNSNVLLFNIEEIVSITLIVYSPDDGHAIAFCIEPKHFMQFSKMSGYEVISDTEKVVICLDKRALSMMDFMDITSLPNLT